MSLKTEQFLSLDINRLRRAGGLEPDTAYVHPWRLRTGGECSCFIVCLSRTRLTIGYRWHDQWAIDVEPTDEFNQYKIDLAWTPCNYGGERPWFLCPNIHCRRRVGKLFLAGRYFCCRHCYRLKYASQSESPEWRAHRRLDRVARKLGADSGHPGLPGRPKGMHRARYDRIVEEFFEAEDVVDAHFIASSARLAQSMGLTP